MAKIIYNLVFNRKKQLNAQGMALVQVEAYLNRRKKYFSTKVYLKPKEWDTQKHRVKRHPNAERLNWMLQEMLIKLEQKELTLWQQGENVTLELLKNAWEEECEEGTFREFYRKEIELSSLRESSKRNHLSTLSVLQEFKREMTFADITPDRIQQFEHFLQSRKYHPNTIAKHMKHLKRVVNSAIDKGYLETSHYAFKKYHIKTVESHHTHLSPEELLQLEAVTLCEKEDRLRSTLDAFLFCCYTGLRYSDFVNLTSANIVTIQGNIWLVYRSVKTNIEVRLPLYLLFDGKAVNILRRYDGHLEDFFKLRNNSNINKELNRITALANIEKHISFHTARHTNATLLIYKGVNITTVQKLLGHRNVRTTQIYTNIMDMTIVHDLERNQE